MQRTFLGLACLAFLCACGGGSGGGTQEQPAGSPQSDAVSISGTPATLVWEGETYAFKPHGTGPDGGALAFDIVNRPPWADFNASTGLLSGVPGAADVGTYAGVRIRVSDGTHEAWLSPFDLRVDPVSHGAVTLTWTPPSHNTDDSPLEDLAGVKIYWGTDPRKLTESVWVAGAGISAYLVENLSPGKYYFASAAMNASGIESAMSNFAVILVR